MLIKTIKLLEYTKVFSGKYLDIKEEIKCFSRNTLLKVVFTLARDFNDFLISDMKGHPFFSYKSQYADERMRSIEQYIAVNGIDPNLIAYAGEKTLLELLKLTFSVEAQVQSDKYSKEVAEAKIFDLLLAINEQNVVCVKPSTKQNHNLPKTLYVIQYASNEMSNYNIDLALIEQKYYADSFSLFIKREYKELYNYFLKAFEICNWQDYFNTILMIVCWCKKYGVKKFSIKKCDLQNVLNKKVIDHISIDINAHIEVEGNDGNRDFSEFRYQPLIKINEDEYQPICTKFIIDRLYNGIYFDLMNCGLKFCGKEFSQFYKETFVEKYLFDRTLIPCLNESRMSECFPKVEDVMSGEIFNAKEEVGQPDFYFREGKNIFLFECKAIKLNGIFKEESDIDKIIDELSNKLFLKKGKNVDGGTIGGEKGKSVGVGQLINHIVSLERNSFKWNSVNTKECVYYPILVLENNEVAQEPLTVILNEWYQESIRQKGLPEKKCMPVVALTIKTLFLYNDYLKKDGFKHYIDRYINEILRSRNPLVAPFCSFDSFMLTNVYYDKHDHFTK